ncbi:MAG: ankyrin repeat domain-containing protein [Akkermansiaceae bacterium]|nr:ankyrin repeat domain-containing protein [Akkermansiaceae bacterium]
MKVCSIIIALLSVGMVGGEESAPTPGKQVYLDVLNSSTLGYKKDYERRMAQEYPNDSSARPEPVSFDFSAPGRQYGASDAARLAAFKALYALGEDVKTLTDEYGMTGMSYAIRLNDRASVDELRALGDDLQFGAYTEDKHDGDCCCSFDCHPSGYVEEALISGHEDMARYLLSSGAAPTGLQWCIVHDRLPMLKELLAAGGTVREDEAPIEFGYIANFTYARSPEMLRFLMSETPYAQLHKSEIIFLINIRENTWLDGEKEKFMELIAQAGVLTKEDWEAYERGGIAQLMTKLLSMNDGHPCDFPCYPLRRGYGGEPLWMPFEDAIRIFRALAGEDAGKQDAAVLFLLLYPQYINEQNPDEEPCSITEFGNLCLQALCIIGDERFSALLSQLSPKQLAAVAFTADWGVRERETICTHYPLTAAALKLEPPREDEKMIFDE